MGADSWNEEKQLFYKSNKIRKGNDESPFYNALIASNIKWIDMCLRISNAKNTTRTIKTNLSHFKKLKNKLIKPQCITSIYKFNTFLMKLNENDCIAYCDGSKGVINASGAGIFITKGKQ